MSKTNYTATFTDANGVAHTFTRSTARVYTHCVGEYLVITKEVKAARIKAASAFMAGHIAEGKEAFEECRYPKGADLYEKWLRNFALQLADAVAVEVGTIVTRGGGWAGRPDLADKRMQTIHKDYSGCAYENWVPFKAEAVEA